MKTIRIDIDMDYVIIAAIIVVVMLIGMRLIYGYWPWQMHPKLRRQREQVIKELTDPTGFDFQPVVKQDKGKEDHFDRGAQPEEK